MDRPTIQLFHTRKKCQCGTALSISCLLWEIWWWFVALGINIPSHPHSQKNNNVELLHSLVRKTQHALSQTIHFVERTSGFQLDCEFCGTFWVLREQRQDHHNLIQTASQLHAKTFLCQNQEIFRQQHPANVLSVMPRNSSSRVFFFGAVQIHRHHTQTNSFIHVHKLFVSNLLFVPWEQNFHPT